MRVIITYVSAGAGHFKAAEAICNYLKERDKDIDVELIDVLKKSNKFFRFIYPSGYAFTVKHTPLLWGFIYWITYLKPLRKLSRYIVSIINRLNTREFRGYLSRKNPEFIISTHFLPAEIAAGLKINQKINSKIITVITDFRIHPFWISKGTDFYIAATNLTKKELISEGIKKDLVRESGIPIGREFLACYDKEALFKRFSLDKNKFTALISTGSFGIGPIEKIIAALYTDTQILVVCANNKKLYKRLKKKNFRDVSVFGFINNIYELMAVSDIIITKPGGLSISESIAMRLIPLFITPIPGQEEENIKALAEYGIGIYPKNTAELKKTVENLKSNPMKLETLKENMAKIHNPSMLKEIYNVIRESNSGAAG